MVLILVEDLKPMVLETDEPENFFFSKLTTVNVALELSSFWCWQQIKNSTNGFDFSEQITADGESPCKFQL